jgi:hypothetical protein
MAYRCFEERNQVHRAVHLISNVLAARPAQVLTCGAAKTPVSFAHACTSRSLRLDVAKLRWRRHSKAERNG